MEKHSKTNGTFSVEEIPELELPTLAELKAPIPATADEKAIAELKWHKKSAQLMIAWAFFAELLALIGHLGIAHHHRKDPLAFHYQMSCVGSLAAFGVLFFRTIATWSTWKVPLACIATTTIAVATLTLR